MKKILLFVTALLSTSLFSVALVKAQEPCDVAPDSTYCQELKKASGSNTLFGPKGIVTRVTQFFTIVAGVVSIFMMILGGIRFITSEGVPQRVNSARSTIIYSAIGIIVTLAAQAIVSFILNRI